MLKANQTKNTTSFSKGRVALDCVHHAFICTQKNICILMLSLNSISFRSYVQFRRKTTHRHFNITDGHQIMYSLNITNLSLPTKKFAECILCTSVHWIIPSFKKIAERTSDRYIVSRFFEYEKVIMTE